MTAMVFVTLVFMAPLFILNAYDGLGCGHYETAHSSEQMTQCSSAKPLKT